MNTQRIGSWTFRLNRNGRPYEAIEYHCHVTGVRMPNCSHCEYGTAVEQDMLNWYNGTFSQMQDRIVTANRMKGRVDDEGDTEDSGGGNRRDGEEETTLHL